MLPVGGAVILTYQTVAADDKSIVWGGPTLWTSLPVYVRKPENTTLYKNKSTQPIMMSSR